VKISSALAANLLQEDARASESGDFDRNWEEYVERLSQLCIAGGSSTHIAFLGTSILARAMSSAVDLFAIKPSHAQENDNAYSARTLCHSVLVPLAAELGINLGVTGREPLNNQPYFRMTYLDDGTPVHASSRPAFDYMLGLVRRLGPMSTNQARAALRAFIAVRRRYQPRYATASGSLRVTSESLSETIRAFVQQNSEGGRRAQAVVAGLCDAIAGPPRVESGRINDPSRHYPGDVCIRSIDGASWEKAFEVRDKPVTEADALIFAQKCISLGVREAVLVLAAPTQRQLDQNQLQGWAMSYGIGLSVFVGWEDFVMQCLFWSPIPKPDATIFAVERIEHRLVEVEASPAAVASWHSLTRQP